MEATIMLILGVSMDIQESPVCAAQNGMQGGD